MFWRLGVSLLAIFFIAAAVDAARFFSQPLMGDRYFLLKKGTGFEAFLEALEEQSVLLHPQDKYYLKAYLLAKRQAGKIQAGEYDFFRGEKPLQWLNKILRGQMKPRFVRFIEGWTLEQALDELRKNPFLEHFDPPLTLSTVMERLELSETVAEGMFFPDTYRFTYGMSEDKILLAAYRRMQLSLEEEWKQRDRSVPYQSPFQALIVASLIEKETRVPSERSLVAGVICRRLQKGMRLQIDASVLYGLGPEHGNRLFYSDLKKDTDFNTYLRSGLPPTPICLPSLAALHAACHPDAGEALYYVADGSGGHIFSTSWEEHTKAVEKYREFLQARPPETTMEAGQ